MHTYIQFEFTLLILLYSTESHFYSGLTEKHKVQLPLVLLRIPYLLPLRELII